MNHDVVVHVGWGVDAQAAYYQMANGTDGDDAVVIPNVHSQSRCCPPIMQARDALLVLYHTVMVVVI